MDTSGFLAGASSELDEAPDLVTGEDVAAQLAPRCTAVGVE
jgi:hypothetical protein